MNEVKNDLVQKGDEMKGAKVAGEGFLLTPCIAPSIFVPLCRFAAKTFPRAKFMAIPRPRKKKDTTTTGNGGVHTIGM